jgi:hypothetical protein
MISAMAVPSFIPISPQFGRRFARPIVDSWNRNSMIGKARAHLGREVLVCVPHLDV